MRVASEAGDGKIRIGLTFAGWSEGKVAPAKVEAAIEKAKE